MSYSGETIPIIDLAPIAGGADEALPDISRQIRDACEQVGFFYVVNHGVPARVQEDAFAMSRAFFALPEAEKARVATNALYRGFTSAEDLIGNDGGKYVGGREYFNMGHELAPDHPAVLAGEDMCGPNLWPDAPEGMREALTNYYEAGSACSARIMRAIAVSLDAPPDFFERKYEEKPATQFTILHYPPIDPEAPQNSVSIPGHTDYGGITLLAQDDTGGLQIKGRKSGAWIEAQPIPGSFVVNVADLLARWSNNRFVSTVHRVVNRSARDRYSIGLFYNPRTDAIVDPRDLGVSEAESLYSPIKSGVYIRGRFEDLHSDADAA